MYKYLFIIIVLLLQTSFPQTRFGLGLKIDSVAYTAIPQNTKLMRGDFSNMPTAVSLKKFAPVPGDQGEYGTCTGWASAYAGRTILEAIKYNLSREEIESRKYSPSFVYNQIRKSNDCYNGALITDALDILKNRGGLYFSEFGYDCRKGVNDSIQKIAQERKIIEYRQVANKRSGNMVFLVKKSLSEFKPVITVFDVANSFFSPGGALWKPDSSEYKSWNQGHAITVIGYDDTTYGGAFELLNSWGTGWGNKGFIWVKYSDFEYFCQWAYELIDATVKDPKEPDLSGSLSFRENNGEFMRTQFNGNSFVTTQAYPTATLFELRISNNEPAYVYAFATDTSGIITKIFPQSEKISAFLPYHQNNIAIPDEDSYNELDSTRGTSYYCFLYAKQALSIDEIIRKITSGSGSFLQKIASALGNKAVDLNTMNITSSDQIVFKGRSMGKTVLPIVIEIRHK